MSAPVRRSVTDDGATVAELGSALRRGEVSAVELTREALRRIARRDPEVNAFALVDAVGALDAAGRADVELAGGRDRGPLHGIPVAVKDLVDVRGLPTTCGSASSFGVRRAEEDAEVVARLRGAGAVIVGKTTLHEFAHGITGDRSARGASRNPHDLTRMSGGSSGGSAAAVAAGMVPLAVGTDTVGSVRVPAALCGVVGFKPAFDAIATAGVHPCAPSLDHVGLFARTCADVALAYAVLVDAAPEALEPREPVAGWIPPGDLGPVDARVESRVRGCLTASGLALRDATGLAQDRDGALFALVSTLQGKEAYGVHRQHLDADRDLIDDEVLGRLLAGREVTDAAYARADAARRAFRATVMELLRDVDVLALPTTPVVAPPIGRRRVTVGADADAEVRATLVSLTCPFNLAGLPALSVPAGTVDGLPVGAQLVSTPADAGRLLALGGRLEAGRRETLAAAA